MFLVPEPREIIFNNGCFNLNSTTEILLDSFCSFKSFEAAKMLKEEIVKSTGIKVNINKSFAKQDNSIYLNITGGAASEKEGYDISIAENAISISGNDEAGLFYGIQTLRQIIRQEDLYLPCLNIKDSPCFKNRGFFHDVTRGKVPTLKTLKGLVDRLAFYKINHLEIYIEHTFAFKDFSEVWTGKDPLTAEEIMELDRYCSQRNIELVPTLPTFGHLYEVLITKSFSHLSELDIDYNTPFTWYDRMAHHTLNVSDDESFEFVKKMLQEFIPLFSSNKFNIDCDETFDLGKGKSRELDKKLGTDRLYTDFLKKVISYVQSYNKEVMFWGDIIVKGPELLQEVPKDAVCLNWAYYPGVTEDDTRKIAESGIKQYVCPGVGGWNCIMNAIGSSFTNIFKMISYGKKYGAIGVLNTDWGDYGHINLFANSMPGMIYGAALSWNTDSIGDVDLFIKNLSDLEYGNKSQELIPLIKELSEAEEANWSHIIWWRENKLIENEFLSQTIKAIHDINPQKAAAGYKRALEIEKELTLLLKDSSEDRRSDIREFINSARGVALVNAVCLAIKRYDLKEENTETVIGNIELAKALEYWFADFTCLWRERNKESELYRLRDVIVQLCSFLRTAN